jgi:hypothetical protein
VPVPSADTRVFSISSRGTSSCRRRAHLILGGQQAPDQNRHSSRMSRRRQVRVCTVTCRSSGSSLTQEVQKMQALERND